jgi:hypothetical protein
MIEVKSKLLTRRNILVASLILAAALAAFAYFALRRPPRVDMARYVPASALAFVEIDNLADLFADLTGTKAWRELGAALGLSSQLGHIGAAADLISRTGLGPDEAVVAGRAQLAIVLTGIEAETGTTVDGPYLHLRPQFALIVETHLKAEAAERLVRERARLIAERVYGQSVVEESQDYSGARLLVFHGPQPGREIIAASRESIVMLANHREAIKSSLDAIAGHTAAVADDATLRELRPAVARDGAVFGFVTEAGVMKLVEFGPALFARQFTSDPERAGSIVSLFEHLSKQTTRGLLYSSEFQAGGVTEKFLTALRPQVAEGLAEPMKAAPRASFTSPDLVPREADSLTILNVSAVGELPERVLKQLSPRVDVVAALALREFVINLREQLGLEGDDSLGSAVGDEMALVKFANADPLAMLVPVNDRAAIAPRLARYLSRGGATTSTERYNGTEISTSSNEDRRAAAFVGEFLVLGTRDQITRIIDTQASGDALAKDDRFKQALRSRPANASIISYSRDVADTAQLMLELSRLVRATDGSSELLERQEVREAIDRLPPTVSFTEFRDYGVYRETRSALGSFSLISTLMGGEE